MGFYAEKACAPSLFWWSDSMGMSFRGSRPFCCRLIMLHRCYIVWALFIMNGTAPPLRQDETECALLFLSAHSSSLSRPLLRKCQPDSGWWAYNEAEKPFHPHILIIITFVWSPSHRFLPCCYSFGAPF